MDSLPSPCRRSARLLVDCLSPSLHEVCSRFVLSCGLFLGLVCPLWLCDLGKFVWESLELVLEHSRVHLFREDFLSATIHPVSGRLIGPSEANHKERRGFVYSKFRFTIVCILHLSLSQQDESISTTCLASLRWSFPPRRQYHNCDKLTTTHHTLELADDG
jgi:hypothetical protein